MFGTLFVFIVCVAAQTPSDSATEQPDADVIIQKWVKTCENATSAHVTFTSYQYDKTFNVVKKGQNEVYLTATDGWWSISPPENDDGTAIQKREKRCAHCPPWTIRKASRSVWIWSDDTIKWADGEARTIVSGKKDARFFGFGPPIFSGISEQLTFFPGLPQKKPFDGWKWNIAKETDDEYWLWGIPPKEFEQFRKFQLILSKTELKLRAVQMISSMNREVVFVFDTVDLDPEIAPEFDVSGYTEEGVDEKRK